MTPGKNTKRFFRDLLYTWNVSLMHKNDPERQLKAGKQLHQNLPNETR